MRAHVAAFRKPVRSCALEPSVGIEPTASSLPMTCSTTELQGRCGRPERVAGIEPATLAWKARALPLCNTRDCPWAGRDSNPRTACRTDLQSVAFNHSATYPRGRKLVTGRDPGVLLPSNGADDRIRTDDLDFTKVLLYQLSYVGDGPRTLRCNRPRLGSDSARGKGREFLTERAPLPRRAPP